VKSKRNKALLAGGIVTAGIIIAAATGFAPAVAIANILAGLLQ
jgi:hypothetical protein